MDTVELEASRTVDRDALLSAVRQLRRHIAVVDQWRSSILFSIMAVMAVSINFGAREFADQGLIDQVGIWLSVAVIDLLLIWGLIDTVQRVFRKKPLWQASRKELHKRIEQLRTLGVADRLLSGDMNGNEMLPHVRRYLRWAYPSLRAGDTTGLLRRVANNLDWYISTTAICSPAWLSYFLPVLIAWLAIALFMFFRSPVSMRWFTCPFMGVYLCAWLPHMVAPMYGLDGSALLEYLESELGAKAEQQSS